MTTQTTTQTKLLTADDLLRLWTAAACAAS